MKKIKKIFIATVITSSLIVVPALASPNVNQIEQNKEETEKKLEDANSKLVTLLTDFEVLKGDIRNQEAKITLADKVSRQCTCHIRNSLSSGTLCS